MKRTILLITILTVCVLSKPVAAITTVSFNGSLFNHAEVTQPFTLDFDAFPPNVAAAGSTVSATLNLELVDGASDGATLGLAPGLSHLLTNELSNDNGFTLFNAGVDLGAAGFIVAPSNGSNSISLSAGPIAAPAIPGTIDLMLSTLSFELSGRDGSGVSDQVIFSATFTLTPPTSDPNGGAIPEPVTATLGLISLGVLGMATRRRVA